ncbi:hypothetical protein [Virgibacillus sp. CBA3643]|uniref:hypothetical protein n=1 Tax=Virgibacillus sp. CBA3643 TaxID=2942278 RepID=UPI0035A3C590
MIDDMKGLLEVQGADGNWNYDSYMLGMYNGMELMAAIAEGREPVFRESPALWVKDNPDTSEPISERTK